MKIDIPLLPVYSPCWKQGKLSHGRLYKKFTFEVEHSSLLKRKFTIPEGFIWDGNSIPRIAWALTGTPWAMDLLCAGLIHDWLYKSGLVSRKIADDIHYQACRQCGVGWYRAQKMHKALRVAGWHAWNKHRKNDKNE